jgi:hypothetical protein
MMLFVYQSSIILSRLDRRANITLHAVTNSTITWTGLASRSPRI